MLPMAGLFLPETLHRRDGPATSQAEQELARPNFFQRTSLRPDREAREARLSATSFLDMRSSSEDVADFPSSTIAFQFADFVFASGKASSDSRDLAFLIDRVRQDVAEASRLYLSPTVLNFLDAWPDKKSRIDTILLDVRRALNDIGEYVADTFRVPGDDGETFGLKRKLEWISRQHKKITAKQQLLSTCHHSLITAINIMQTVELCGVNNGAWQDPIYEAPVHPWVKPDDSEVLRGPYSRRETRMSQKNLSLSSMYLPQTEQESVKAHSVNSSPVELPGSTVEDLAMSRESIASITRRPQNSYRHSSARRSYFRSSVADGTKTASSNDRSPVAELEHTQLQAPSNFITSRRSFDSSLPAHSGPQTELYQAYHSSMRRSSDFAQSLPTLNEKTIERNDSTTSTTAIVTAPQVAKRYHANPIYIRKSRDRHRSLPSTLPHVHSHSSLTDDLADYMVHLSPQSDQIPSVEWDAGSNMASLSTTVESWPAATQAPTQGKAPLKVEEVSKKGSDEEIFALQQPSDPGDDTPAVSSYANTQEQPSSDTPHFDSVKESNTSKERAPSIRSVSSMVNRKPLPATAAITSPPLTTATITSPASSNAISALDPPATITTETPEVANQAIDIDPVPSKATIDSPPADSETVYSPTPPLIHDDDDLPLGLLQQKLLHQTYVPEFPQPPLAAKETADMDKSTGAPSNTVAVAEISRTLPGTEKNIAVDKSTSPPAVVLVVTDMSSPQPVAEKPAEPDANADAPPKATVLSDTNEPTPSITTAVPEAAPGPAKPMSAQAKRRAAHQRRMELAFGKC